MDLTCVVDFNDLLKDRELVRMQGEAMLRYKKDQLAEAVTARRDSRIKDLRAKVRQQEQVRNYKHGAAAAAPAVPTATPVPLPVAVAVATSTSAKTDSGKRASPSGCKRPRPSGAAAAAATSATSSDDDDYPKLLIDRGTNPSPKHPTVILRDTPLLQLLQQVKREYVGNAGVLSPPCCGSDMCGYATGCLHGQRRRLAARLLEVEYLLYGKSLLGDV